MVSLNINGQQKELHSDWFSPLLWALRDELKLTGTKFGCGRGFCGACTIHLDGQAVRSCSLMVGEAIGKEIVTIEGLSGRIADIVEAAWVKAEVPQCGYCQPGFVMAVTSLLQQAEHAGRSLSADVLKQKITNICRCGTYDAMREALDMVLANLGPTETSAREQESRK